MEKLTLKHIETMPFGQGEHTMYKSLIKRYPHLAALDKGDVVLVHSRGGEQMIFIYGFTTVSGERGVDLALTSKRIRLPHSRPWNPLMLQNYANEAGLELTGKKLLEEHWTEREEEHMKIIRARKIKKAAAAKKSESK